MDSMQSFNNNDHNSLNKNQISGLEKNSKSEEHKNTSNSKSNSILSMISTMTTRKSSS